MNTYVNYGVEQIRKQATYVALALACVICGCGEKKSPPQAAAADKSQPATATPAIAPATQPKIAEPTPQKPKHSAEVLSLDSLMDRIPKEFTVSKDEGWDKFTMPKVQKWVQENLCGKRGRVNVYMLQCNVAQDRSDPKPDEWIVRMAVTGRHVNYAGMGNRLLPVPKEDSKDYSGGDVGIWGKASFVFKCTEAEARKWDAHSKASFSAVVVEGDIVEILFQPRLGNVFQDVFVGYDTFVQLENVAMTPSKDTELGALHIPEFVMAQYGNLREPSEAILDIKRLDNSGDYQLLFLKYHEWSSGQNAIKTELLSFPLVEQSLHDFDAKMKHTSCDDPPTESQIAAAKAAVSWPKN